jgi:hypothetical protein
MYMFHVQTAIMDFDEIVTKKLILLQSGQLEPLLYTTMKPDVSQIFKKCHNIKT